MSMNPVTPGKFNPVLASTMTGGIVTAQLCGSLISRLARYHWINSSSASYCRFIVNLSARTRALTHGLAATLRRPELQRAQASLAKWADDSHAYLVACFEPDEFREVALDRLRYGGCPKMVAHECVTELFRKLFDFLDKVQSERMKENSEEWRRVADFKQDLVNYWGTNGFDISRSYGRESNYFWTTALRVVSKCIAYPLFGMLVVGGGLVLAIKLGIGGCGAGCSL